MTTARRVLLSALFLLGIGAMAYPAHAFDRRPVVAEQKAPTQCEAPGPKWIATVRFDAQGVIGAAGPHLQVLSSSAMGLSGVPAAATAGGGTSIMLTITPDEAREFGQALLDWADNPTDSTVFSRIRKYPTPPNAY